jgi:hypothetical protein
MELSGLRRTAFESERSWCRKYILSGVLRVPLIERSMRFNTVRYQLRQARYHTRYLDRGPGAKYDTASINNGELSQTACKFDAFLRFGQFNTRLWECQREAKHHEEEKNRQQTEDNTDADEVG